MVGQLKGYVFWDRGLLDDGSVETLGQLGRLGGLGLLGRWGSWEGRLLRPWESMAVRAIGKLERWGSWDGGAVGTVD